MEEIYESKFWKIFLKAKVKDQEKGRSNFCNNQASLDWVLILMPSWKLIQKYEK